MNRFFREKMDIGVLCPLLLLLTSFFWRAGYYEYSSAIIGVIAAVMIGAEAGKKGRKLRYENYLFFSGCLTFFYLISCIFATDLGMALIGVVKKSTILLFALSLSMLTVEQRKRILYWLPEMAVLTVGLGAICAIFPVTRSYAVAAGRFCGTFGYANSYAVFLLLALMILLESYAERKGWGKFVLGGILLLALWFTGSRYSWILTGIALLVYGIRQKKMRKVSLGILGILGAATLAAATIFRQGEAMGRFFTTNLSTLWGRLLYWLDGWKLVKSHSFGMGYLGYYYEQNQVQTGVYTVRYVHNDLLQWLLDLGWLPFLFLLLIVAYVLFSKKRSQGQKGLLLIFLVHSCFEFDLEHTAVAFLWVLLLSCGQEPVIFSKLFSKCQEIPEAAGKYTALILGGLCLYMAIPLSMYASGNMETALAWYPLYTDARLALLSEEENPDKAEKMADEILEQNDTAFLAYDAKAQLAFQKHEFEAMMYNKRCAIERNKYDANEYMDYLNMLNEVLIYSQQQWDQALQERIIREMEQLLKLIQKNQATVSSLGRKIDDQVDIALPGELVEQIENLR